MSLDEAEGELMTGRSRPRGGRGFSADSLLTRGGEWVHTSLTGFYGNPHQQIWREIGEIMRFIFMDFTGEHYGLAASLVFTAKVHKAKLHVWCPI